MDTSELKQLSYKNSIESLADYLAWVSRIAKNFGLRSTTIGAWYRGQCNEAWTLKPTLYRSDVSKDKERELIRDFKIKASEFVDLRSRNDVDWMFLAQHYGVPTRLLDWTENPLVALYFSCNDRQIEVDGRVWALNPWELNKSTVSISSVPLTDSKEFSRYVVDITDSNVPRAPSAEQPMAVRPYRIFRRSNAQKGIFTIHGCKEQAIDRNVFVRRNKSACLQSIKIAASKKKKLIRELYEIGISDASLFETLDAIAKEVKYRYSNDFIKPLR